MIHNAVDDPYGAKKTRRRARASFAVWRRTPDYRRWRSNQYDVQGGRCAWCQNSISRSPCKTHVDHAMPLFHGGTNDPSNLVLAHKRCNLEKWVRVDATPLWVRQRQQELQDRREQYDYATMIANEVLDEIALEQIKVFI